MPCRSVNTPKKGKIAYHRRVYYHDQLMLCQSSPTLGLQLILGEVTIGSPAWNSGLR